MPSTLVTGNSANDGSNILSCLYNKYANTLYNYGVGLGFSQDTCMDAIHDVFCKLALNESRIEKLIGEGREKFYLFCCLKNRLIDISRREGRMDQLDLKAPTFGFEISIEDSISDEEERSSLKIKVEELMSELSPSQRETVYLRYMQDMSYEEIAQLLNISPESARKNLFRAMNKMRLAAKKNPAFTVILLLLHI